jgi:hypothetical protein
MNQNFTISTNVARGVTNNLPIPFRAAKLGFHAGIGGAAAVGVRALGGNPLLAVGVGVLTCAWLESFDSSRNRW